MLLRRRHAVLFATAVCLILLVGYYREPIITRTPLGAQVPLPPSSALDVTDPDFRWSNVPIRYPVKRMSPIPSRDPDELPKVQFDFSSRPETKAQIAERRERQAAVKRTFARCWKAYRERAWTHDELAPLSGGFKDGFGGWAANAVDNLDTLFLMDMKVEFEEAVEVVADIDLTTSTLDQINVFETTIRHLGGLLAAYDLSGDERLLTKAREFGDMLIVAFDTKNRMPITRWNWREAPTTAQVANEHVLVAEIGSLSVEFTRLSMLTDDPKWYDAVERIYRVFEDQQRKTLLPGMWPVSVSAARKDFTDDTLFTLSAMSDSLYEYFPKMHALLGGVDPRYQKLYSGSMKVAIENNLFRPMVPDDADILISGSVRRANPKKPPTLDAQGQHLVCFAGGMFALGGKLFNEPSHVEIGRKIADGCVWTYRAMPMGIMPEVFRMLPCESLTDCTWNETAWKEGVAAEYGGDMEEVDDTIAYARVPPGFTRLIDHRYILRPEAIESVFILYRVTGDRKYLDAAWDMFTAIVNATETEIANAALRDISFTKEQVERGQEIQVDSMESFWMAETLKYFYLIFGDVDVVSLDEWVFNTEAHPVKRSLP